ncbi:hypothetical protein NHQ30_007312 [Ciborinia camelliae]|nr:hypothetical protein NHQ30_007312 [Ciborinia camelliae]
MFKASYQVHGEKHYPYYNDPRICNPKFLYYNDSSFYNFTPATQVLINLLKMAPKSQRIVVERSARRTAQPKGYLASTYTALTAPENASVVRSIGIFGVAVAFFSSSWSEFLLPPL